MPEAHKEGVKSISEFECSCSDENKKKCEERYERVKKKINKGKDKGFVTAVVYTFEWGFAGLNAFIEGMSCDQWCGVGIEVMQFNKEINKFQKYANMYIQCDEIEYGLARAYEEMEKLADEL